MERLEIEYIRTESLVPYANNAKRHPEQQVEQIAASIRRFGFSDSVGVWVNEEGAPEIVYGHGSVLAARRLGIDEVPCVVLNHLSDEERRAFCHIHNQLTLASDFDLEMLAADMSAIDIDWCEFGFDDLRVEDDFEIIEDEIPESVPTRVERGQLWELGEHRLMCGSSTDADDMGRLAGGAVSVNLLMTDPPYNVALGRHKRPSEMKHLRRRTDGLVIENDSFADENAFVEFLAEALSISSAYMHPGAAFYIFHAETHASSFLEACRRSDLPVRQTLIWNKNSFTLGRNDYQWKHEPCLYGWKPGAAHSWYSDRRQSTVIDFDRPTRSEEHPTMKPVGLIAYLIGNSTVAGDTVLDCFSGSGSTLMACEQLGRRCLAMEIDPHFADVIIERWERRTGREACLIEDW